MKKPQQNLNTEGLIPFKPGDERAKKGGRPKGSRNMQDILIELFGKEVFSRDPITGEDRNITVKERLALSLIGKAMKGDVPAFKELMDRAEGKVTDKVDVTTSAADPFDPTKLTTEELKTLETLLAKSARGQG